MFSKKIVSLLIVAVAISTAQAAFELTDDQKMAMVQFARSCITESGADGETVKAVLMGDFSQADTLQEFALCFGQKIGIMDSEANFQDEYAMSMMPEGSDKQKAQHMIDTCKNESGASPAEKAYKIFKCFYQLHPMHISFN